MALNVDYKQLLEAQKDDDVLIVDVREHAEINETGKLPGSIHIPMDNVRQIFLNLSEEEFEERYSRPKPSKDTKIIFSCRSGKRSGAVQEAMQKLGYTRAYNYTGGWLDWESKSKS
ncbi:thiosulfate sulfurtransferase/rhodanese-like domain-containing protein 3 isoform X2 [Nylanderia fulva]|nr:thiosulfate sulfurtransferase/rhodanese-like domain-containing protein 3 isoform X2 [Nylanderia fulva]